MRFKAFCQDRSGAAAMEMALVCPMLILLIVGCIQIGWAMHCASSVRWALERNARGLIMNPNMSASSLRQAMISSLTGLSDSQNIAVTVAQVTTSGAKTLVAQSVYSKRLTILFLPSYNLTFTASTSVPTT